MSYWLFLPALNSYREQAGVIGYSLAPLAMAIAASPLKINLIIKQR